MTGVDLAVFNFFNGLTGKFFLIDWAFIFFSEYLIYVLVGLFIFLLLRMKNWRRRGYTLALGVMAVILSRGIFTPLIRFFYEKPRPFALLDIEPLVSHAAISSFPSGHIAFIFPIAMVLWYTNKRVGTWAFIGVFLIGIARIGAGLHWPTDIVGGLLVGSVCFALAQTFLKRSLVAEKPSPKKKVGAPVGTPQ